MSVGTYALIGSYTLTGNQNNITFSSIPSTYTDLVIVAFAKAASTSSGADNRIQLQFNGDTGTNYSATYLLGSGTTASSSRDTNRTQVDNILNVPTSGGSEYGIYIYHIQDYSNTTTYKTGLMRGNFVTATGGAIYGVGEEVFLWRSTAAINSIKIYGAVSNTDGYASGSTFKLYGIQAGNQ